MAPLLGKSVFAHSKNRPCQRQRVARRWGKLQPWWVLSCLDPLHSTVHQVFPVIGAVPPPGVLEEPEEPEGLGAAVEDVANADYLSRSQRPRGKIWCESLVFSGCRKTKHRSGRSEGRFTKNPIQSTAMIALSSHFPNRRLRVAKATPSGRRHY